MGKAVLVVEDNEDNLLIVATILKYYDYEVLTAADGESAIDIASQSRPNLILLDISLPRMDGWDVARVLKSNEALATIPLIAFTAHAYDADRELASKLGFAGFLTKPVEPLRILDEVRRVIGSA